MTDLERECKVVYLDWDGILRQLPVKLLQRILGLRDSIQAERGILSESYPLLHEDRER